MLIQKRALAVVAAEALGVVLVFGGVASAHPHSVETPHHTQTLANGQNHPGFVADTGSGLFVSCDGINEPANSGPAGYGLETAHHGADAGEPGRADGCYATDGTPQDNNPAID